MKQTMPVFVRAKSGEACKVLRKAEIAPGPDATAPATVVRADTEAALSEEGPFAPLGLQIVANDALRQELARELRVESATRYDAIRFLALTLALPAVWLLLTDLTRVDLSSRARATVLALDALGAIAVAHDVTRRAPYRRWVVWAVVLGADARIVDALADACILRAPPIFIALGTLAFLAFWSSRVEPPRLVARQVLDALNVSVDAVLALPESPPPSAALVAASVVSAGGLFLIVRHVEPLSSLVQNACILGWAISTTLLATRLLETPRRGDSANAAPPPPGPQWLPARTREGIARVALLGGIGFVGAYFLAEAAHRGLDAGAHALRCRDVVSFESSGGKRQLLLETVEAIQARARARDSSGATLFFVLSMPIATALVFRGFLQRILARRFGGIAGLTVSVVAFALTDAHGYESLFYRSVAVGIAVGAVYAEVGLAAALIAHVLYCALLVL